MDKIYVDMGKGEIISGRILRKYTWGALVQCGYQCFKVSDNHIFNTLQEAREASRKGRKKENQEAVNA